MPVAHILLALLVTLIWGLNFVVIKVGLGDFPPLLFCALRFALAALPLLVLRGPMPAPFGRILLIGVLLGVVKFGLLFVGMAQGMPAGLSSLVLQSQVFFTILIAALWLGERPSPRGLFGLLLAAARAGPDRPGAAAGRQPAGIPAGGRRGAGLVLRQHRHQAFRGHRHAAPDLLGQPGPAVAAAGAFLSIRRSASHRARSAEHELGRLRRAATSPSARPRWASPSGVSSCATTRPAW